ncbi:hypothetical protein KJ762_02445 [bacterium]|nr:hypothetical protein [bacterium]MBU1065989.1 hypothetical protein [bacterium]MBU1633352.1 hypothetical protein [bacterium]MBU1872993.1 hypothetical protein [bacterium]
MLLLIDKKIDTITILKLCQAHFGNFIKFVADIDRKVIAAGGEMHADAEVLLLNNGSKQVSLWGANLYPENEPEKRIEFESFINIRPLDDNMALTVQNAEIRHKIKNLVEALLLSPEELIQLED